MRKITEIVMALPRWIASDSVFAPSHKTPLKNVDCSMLLPRKEFLVNFKWKNDFIYTKYSIRGRSRKGVL